MKAFALTVAALLGRALATTTTCPPPATWQVPDITKLMTLSLPQIQKLFLPVVTMKCYVLHLQRPWRQQLQKGHVPHHPCACHQHVSGRYCQDLRCFCKNLYIFIIDENDGVTCASWCPMPPPPDAMVPCPPMTNADGCMMPPLWMPSAAECPAGPPAMRKAPCPPPKKW